MFQECKIERNDVMKRSIMCVNLNHNIIHVGNVIGLGEKN
jgi:hypothetical protein